MAKTGRIAIILAFVLSLYSMTASFYGAKTNKSEFVKSARNAAFAVFVLLTIASLSLIHSLLTLDYSLKYVASNTSNDLRPLYRFTAFWAGQAGSLLLWAWILSIYIALVLWFNRARRSALLPYVLTTLAAISVFFIFIIAFVESPFEKLPFLPVNGRGLNPLLQNAYMAIHPVCLYIGYVGVAIPYAFAMGALLSGKLGDEWIRHSRRWTLFAWSFLAVGLVLGARWAYLELGWGGYWSWDPVENAAFMPWLTATAFLHSVMIQEKKGMLKKWNVSLIIITFFLALFGTFITRSGIISSVHSFAQSDIGPYFLSFIAFVLLFSFSMFLVRVDRLKSENRFESLLSRESAFLFNNLLFLSAALAVFLGTIFPIVTEAIRGNRLLVGPPYFNRVNVPIALVLILLMGVGPLISWRRASKKNLLKNFLMPSLLGLAVAVVLFLRGMRDAYAIISFALCMFVATTVFVEFWRGTRVRARRGENHLLALLRLISKNRRRYGGYIVHIGIVLLVIGVTASSAFVIRREVVLNVGESMTIGKYRLVFDGLDHYTNDAKNATIANLTLYEGGKNLGALRPESNLFKYQGNRQIDKETEIALRSTIKDDLYVVLTSFDSGDNSGGTGGGGRGNFTVLINPMVSWIWAGGIVIALGGLVTMWPSPLERRQEQAVRYSVGIGDEGALKV